MHGCCFGEQAGGRILNILSFFEDLGGDAIQEAIAVPVVKSGCNEGVNECLSSSA